MKLQELNFRLVEISAGFIMEKCRLNPIQAGEGSPYYIFVYISFISNQNKMKFGDFS